VAKDPVIWLDDEDRRTFFFWFEIWFYVLGWLFILWADVKGYVDLGHGPP